MKEVSTDPSVSIAPNGYRGQLLVFGLFVIITLVMTYPFPVLAATHLRDLGDPLEYAWVLGYSAHRLLTDPLRLFDGNIFYPFEGSLAYSDSTIASTIFVLPILLATDNPVLASNVLLLSSFILAGFGTYLLVADLSGSRLAGVIAGIIFAFNPYRMDHLSQIPNVASHWMPLAFWALHRFLGSKSRWWATVFGIFLCLQLLSSFYYAYAVALALAVYVFGLLIRRPRELLQSTVIAPLLGVVACCGAVLLVVALPYFDVSDRYGLRRTLFEAEVFSARPQNYLAVPAFNRTWGQVEQMVRWGGGEKQLFPGLLAVLLAIVGLVRGKPRPQIVRYTAVGAFAFVLSLGPSLFLTNQGPPVDIPFPLPYRILFDYLPGFQSLRVPARFGIVVMLTISVLAGSGAAYLIRRVGRRDLDNSSPRPRPVLSTVLAVILAMVALVEYASFPVPLAPIQTGSAIPEVYKWLREQSEQHVLVELPIDDNAFHQAPYIYFSTYHRWTLVNGWRSFAPPGYRELAGTLQTFPSAESIAVLANLEVRYVIVHSDKLSAWEMAQRQLRFQKYADRVQLVRQFGADYVYEVTAPVSPPSVTVSILSPCLAQPGQRYVASLIFDGYPQRIIPLRELPVKLRVTAEWSSPHGARFGETVTVKAPDRIVRLTDAVQVPLVAPPEPGTYRLTLSVDPPLGPNSVGPVPRTIVVGQPPSKGRGESSSMVQVSAFEIPRKAVKVTDQVPLRITWKSLSSSSPRRNVFVNIYDAEHRYWSFDSKSVFTEAPAEQDWCASDEVLDIRYTSLDPDTPPGYYWVELGLLDPATEQRLPIRDPDGKVVDKVDVGRIRVTATETFGIDDIAPRHPERARLGAQVEFLGWTSLPEAPRPGQALRLKLYWRARGAIETSYIRFVHLSDRTERVIAQHDGQPGNGAYPTSAWQIDDVIEDEVTLQIPADLPAGEYTLVAGMYDSATMGRLQLIQGPDGGNDRILLGPITILPASD